MEGQEEQEAARLRRDAERVEELLDEVQDMVGPPAWQRVEELVTRLVGLYGAGLSRLLEHLERAGAMEPALEERLLSDEAVESLLLLHGLHPETTDQRVRRAVERVRAELEPQSGVDVEVSRIDDGGVAWLRLRGSSGAGAASLEAALRRAVASAAPEVLQVEIEGGGDARQGEGLVNIDVGRSRRRKERS